MNAFLRSQLPDHLLLQSCREHVSSERRATAELLADLAEVDTRRLWAPAGYSSLYTWCVGELNLSEDATCMRTRAARAGREFPAVLEAIAEGRLHLTGVCLLASHLTRENASELIDAATHRSKTQIEELLAVRFPRLDVPTRLEPMAESESGNSSVPERMIFTEAEPGDVTAESAATVPAPPAAPARVAPLSPGRYELRGTLDADAHADLRVAQELLGVHAGDAMAVISRALKLLRRDLERRHCAATEKTRARRRSASGRTIPAAVRREVWVRDGRQCTYVSDSGHRCEERKALELDHVTPVARGGASTVANLRLRCRAHNFHEAEKTFGRGFMETRRAAARQAREAAKVAAVAKREAERDARRAAAEAEREAREAADARTRDVIGALRSLGFRLDEARSAAAACTGGPEQSLEAHVRAALGSLARSRPQAPFAAA